MRRFALLLLVLCAFACRPGTQAHDPEVAHAMAYGAAATTLTLLDSAEADFLRRLTEPTEEELEAARVRVGRLRTLRDMLSTIDGSDLQRERTQLVLAVELLRLAVDEGERAHGLSKEVHDAMIALERLTGVPP